LKEDQIGAGKKITTGLFLFCCAILVNSRIGVFCVIAGRCQYGYPYKMFHFCFVEK
jgi:hypothetical protein